MDRERSRPLTVPLAEGAPDWSRDQARSGWLSLIAVAFFFFLNPELGWEKCPIPSASASIEDPPPKQLLTWLKRVPVNCLSQAKGLAGIHSGCLAGREISEVATADGSRCRETQSGSHQGLHHLRARHKRQELFR